MLKQDIQHLLSEWPEEFFESVGTSSTLCIALFDANRKLLCSTPAMSLLFKGEPHESLINPTYDKLIDTKSETSLVFEGIITIGDLKSLNNSIEANVYLKEGKVLIIGGADTSQLINQNLSMFHLNHKINNLQRQLLKEKLTLENTLTQLSETNSDLQRINASKDKLFSIIGHDLKSPFNSIISLSNLLADQVKNNDLEGIDEYGDLIIKSSQKAMGLLMNLLEWSRSQTGTMVVNAECFNVLDLFLSTNLLFDDIAEQKSITIKNNIPQNVFGFADKKMISTVLRNLISNAIKFTKSGGEINISVIEKQNELIVSVSDNGIGISKDRIEKLFKLDQSNSTTGTNDEIGTGLGLILCKDFAEKNNGEIWVESEEDKGSTFYFTLPNKEETVTTNK